MRKILTVCGAIALFSTLALAETWTGRLVDQTCWAARQAQTPQDQQAQKTEKTENACDVTSSTSSYAVDVNGKIYKLDNEGNNRVTAAMKGRADRSANPNNPATGPVTARVTGTLSGDTITVETVTVM